MSSSRSPLGLPPMSPELKSISPYLQRAEELRAKEPIIAYWCAYYAAQVGIALKAKQPGARNLLFELLAVLETMKEEIGPSDAVGVEAVSSAYVENFALKVFSIADNEDRHGQATRSTAKKFLAAANFFEVLKIFPSAPLSEASEEKVKYSKWKAADIARAFREGRKPHSGPAGSEMDSDSTAINSTPSSSSSSGATLAANSEFAAHIKGGPPSPPLAGKISPKRTSPPPHMTPADIARANIAPREFQPKTPPRSGVDDETDPSSPGSWSTAATPGSEDRSSTFEPTPTKKSDSKRGTSRLRNAWVSDELEGNSDGSDEGDVGISDVPLRKAVRFTPSTGGLTPPVTGPTGGPFIPPATLPTISWNPTSPSSSPPKSTTLPRDIFSATGRPHSSSNSSLNNNGVPSRIRTTSISTSPPHSANVNTPSTPPAPPPSINAPQPSAPPLPYNASYSASTVRSPPAPPPAPAPSSTPPQDLTPQIIAKAQKHCRFAISALDYEDAEQARKELRAALAALGG